MIVVNKFLNRRGLQMLLGLLLVQACNKELPQAVPLEPTPPTDGETILQKLNASEYSILKAAVEKASTFNSTTGKLSDILGNPKGTVTFFAPDNPALLRSFQALGLPADPSSLSFFRAGQLDTMLKYHMVGGEALTSSRIAPLTPAFNMYLQSALVLAPPSADLPPGYRMPIFMGKQGTAAFVNNIPVVTPDIATANGIMHKMYAALLPPTQVLWQTIAMNSGGSYTYFRAAILRADMGVEPARQFQSILAIPNANFTVLAPTNAAFEEILVKLIAQALIDQGTQPAIASLFAQGLVTTYGVTIISNPASIETYGALLAAEITPQLLQGVVAYHIVGKPGKPKTATTAETPTIGYRNFTFNFPVAGASQPTLVNAALETHPGLIFKGVLGPAGVTEATVKGVGNATASKVVLSPLPGATNDINHINGVIQRIDQVLLAQQL
ncbi:fasciclin domain-containing protein [Niabella yanshanensis]|uniref:Fasciclin domain-containing protein n=1 Tax=Niabella yanshanensis TaxID=577386 RepID=A0ABZ0W8R7_9BACT|nr:fasciclin domain-containing protein [Niabella yanshanensis]WQD39339.1 fasciclin domain-containing protein [Niabella yanshanensis]